MSKILPFLRPGLQSSQSNKREFASIRCRQPQGGREGEVHQTNFSFCKRSERKPSFPLDEDFTLKLLINRKKITEY